MDSFFINLDRDYDEDCETKLNLDGISIIYKSDYFKTLLGIETNLTPEQLLSKSYIVDVELASTGKLLDKGVF